MRRPVPRPPHPRDASIGRHDDDRRELRLERAVEEGKALNVEHVRLVDHQDAGDDVGFAFLLPVGDLGVDLVPQLGLDLASVAGKEGEEALRSRIDDIDLVQGDGVDDFFADLQLAFWALNEFGLAHELLT